jgi:hypothetical protein
MKDGACARHPPGGRCCRRRPPPVALASGRQVEQARQGTSPSRVVVDGHLIAHVVVSSVPVRVITGPRGPGHKRPKQHMRVWPGGAELSLAAGGGPVGARGPAVVRLQKARSEGRS